MSKQDQDAARGTSKGMRHRQKREQQKKREVSRNRRQGRIKTVWLLLMAAVILIGGVGGALALQRPSSFPTVPSSSEFPSSDSPVISGLGTHRHIELIISIFGEEVRIPANVGLTPREQPIHTHDDDNIIHLEFGGMVRQDDVRLVRFFEIWRAQFSETCIFENCNGAEGTLSMLVNGESSVEFENYMMQDGDKIEITFE